jgi:hypothetical protein
MTVRTETQHAGGFLVFDGLMGHMCRKQAVLNSGQASVKTGTVLGQILSAAAAVAGTNTGNGVVTVGAAIGSATLIGTYKLLCVTAATNAGTFNLHAPDGTLIRQITVGGGATASDHLTITIADGSTDFAVGDSFTIAVSGGDYEALTVAGTTGVQIAAAIFWEGRDATSADKPCTVVFRDAVVESSELVWPAGITTPQTNVALAQLAARGFQFR